MLLQSLACFWTLVFVAVVLQGCGSSKKGGSPAPPPPHPAPPPYQSLCGNSGYCSPTAKKCFTPAMPRNATCDPKDASTCNGHGKATTCCPLTRVCVEVGVDCDPDASGTPLNGCADGTFCDPLRQNCVEPGPDPKYCNTTWDPKHGIVQCTDQPYTSCDELISRCVKTNDWCQPPPADDAKEEDVKEDVNKDAAVVV